MLPRVRSLSLTVLVGFGGAAAAMFVTDSSYSRHLSNSPSRIKYSKDLSNYGVAAMAGIGGGLWVLGHVTHDRNLRPWVAADAGVRPHWMPIPFSAPDLWEKAPVTANQLPGLPRQIDLAQPPAGGYRPPRHCGGSCRGRRHG